MDTCQLSRIRHWSPALPYISPNLPDKMAFLTFLCFSLGFSPFLPQNWVPFLANFCTYLVSDKDYFSIKMMITNFDSMYSIYRIYSINRPGRLLNFWTLRVGAYSRWALIRGWELIKFSPFSASVVCLFCNKRIYANNKTRRSNKARFL